MISFLESRGYLVYDFDRHSLEYRISAMDELRIWLCHDYPIIVSQWSSPGSGGHYRVVVGYDDENVYTIDPRPGSRTFSIGSFLEYWNMRDEYGIIVLGDPTKDSDGDGLTDSDEVKQNTDPFYTEQALASTDKICRPKNIFDMTEKIYICGRRCARWPVPKFITNTLPRTKQVNP